MNFCTHCNILSFESIALFEAELWLVNGDGHMMRRPSVLLFWMNNSWKPSIMLLNTFLLMVLCQSRFNTQARSPLKAKQPFVLVTIAPCCVLYYWTILLLKTLFQSTHHVIYRAILSQIRLAVVCMRPFYWGAVYQSGLSTSKSFTYRVFFNEPKRMVGEREVPQNTFFSGSVVSYMSRLNGMVSQETHITTKVKDVEIPRLTSFMFRSDFCCSCF